MLRMFSYPTSDCLCFQRFVLYGVDFVKGRSAPIVGSGPAADQDNCRQLWSLESLISVTKFMNRGKSWSKATVQWVLDELELINPGVEKSVRQIEQKLKYMKYIQYRKKPQRWQIFLNRLFHPNTGVTCPGAINEVWLLANRWGWFRED